MYGLVNRAIQEMVCDRFGLETWQVICQKAKVETDRFISMEPYPDDLTHRLVRAASEVLNLSPAEILEAFGEYWILYTAQEGYGEMMAMAGDNLPEFLQNLDTLHSRVGLSFPKLQPPSFDCTDLESESLTLHYHSEREGLAPMVIGLLKGLGTRLETEVDITHSQNRQEGAGHDEFQIRYKPNEPQ